MTTQITTPFREVRAEALSAHRLKDEMKTYGYALIRGVLVPSTLQPLLAQVTEIVEAAGWLEGGPLERSARAQAACSVDDPQYKAVYDEIFRLPALHALLHAAPLARLMQMLTGPELLVHPVPVARLIFPQHAPGIIGAHQDHTAVGGAPESFTAWLPLHDCPAEQGALRILEGSHRFGLRPASADTGYVPAEAQQGGAWAGGEIQCGDVLLFHSLTVHEAAPNTSTRLRISLDCRFQSYLYAVNPAALVFAGSGRRSWPKVYADWPSDELKFYWNRLPLQLKPSRAELEKLMVSAATPKSRERYARILQGLDAQMHEHAGR